MIIPIFNSCIKIITCKMFPMTGSIIGNTGDVTAATTAQFGAFWGELAGRFKSNEKVIFGLMNEVCDLPVNARTESDH